MRKRIAYAFLIPTLLLAFLPISQATAQKENKNSATSPGEPAKTDAGALPGARPGDDKAAPKPANVPATAGQINDKVVLGVGVVSVLVSVTDTYGRFVTGLTKDHFDLFDDKVKQNIAHFTDEDAPISVGIVYDVSGSMKERISRSIKALRRFMETSHEDDD